MFEKPWTGNPPERNSPALRRPDRRCHPQPTGERPSGPSNLAAVPAPPSSSADQALWDAIKDARAPELFRQDPGEVSGRRACRGGPRAAAAARARRSAHAPGRIREVRRKRAECGRGRRLRDAAEVESGQPVAGHCGGQRVWPSVELNALRASFRKASAYTVDMSCGSVNGKRRRAAHRDLTLHDQLQLPLEGTAGGPAAVDHHLHTRKAWRGMDGGQAPLIRTIDRGRQLRQPPSAAPDGLPVRSDSRRRASGWPRPVSPSRPAPIPPCARSPVVEELRVTADDLPSGLRVVACCTVPRQRRELRPMAKDTADQIAGDRARLDSSYSLPAV